MEGWRAGEPFRYVRGRGGGQGFDTWRASEPLRDIESPLSGLVSTYVYAPRATVSAAAYDAHTGWGVVGVGGVATATATAYPATAAVATLPINARTIAASGLSARETIGYPDGDDPHWNVLFGRGMAVWGDVSALAYTDYQHNPPRSYVRFRLDTTGAHNDVLIPDKHLYDTTIYRAGRLIFSSAVDLWILDQTSDTYGCRLSHYSLSGTPLPTTLSHVETRTFGAGYDTAEELYLTASGALVLAYGDKMETSTDLHVEYRAADGTWGTSLTLTVDEFQARTRLAEHPTDGKLWLFHIGDSEGSLDAFRMTDSGSGLTVDATYRDLINTGNYDGVNGMEGELPQVVAVADPTNGCITLAYQSAESAVITATPWRKRAFIRFCRLSSTGTRTFYAGPGWTERVAPFGFAREAATGDYLCFYRGPCDSTPPYNAYEYRLARYHGGAWSVQDVGLHDLFVGSYAGYWDSIGDTYLLHPNLPVFAHNTALFTLPSWSNRAYLGSLTMASASVWAGTVSTSANAGVATATATAYAATSAQRVNANVGVATATAAAYAVTVGGWRLANAQRATVVAAAYGATVSLIPAVGAPDVFTIRASLGRSGLRAAPYDVLRLRTGLTPGWHVFVNGTEDVSRIDLSGLSIIDSGPGSASRLRASHVDYTRALSIPARSTLEVVDDAGNTYWLGRTIGRVRTPMAAGGFTIDIEAADLSPDLDATFIVDASTPAGWSDQDVVRYLLSNYSYTGIIAPDSTVQVTNDTMPALTFTRVSVAKALTQTADAAGEGRVWWVSGNHLWYGREAAAGAPYSIVETDPDGTSTITPIGPPSYEETEDGILNAVWVEGPTGDDGLPVASGWVIDQASIDAYGRRETTLQNQDATTPEKVTLYGSAYLAKVAYPVVRGSFAVTGYHGWRAGQLVSVTNSALGLSNRFFQISQVETRFLDGTGKRAYAINYGELPRSLVRSIASKEGTPA